MNDRERLIRYAIKYQGDYSKIKKAIHEKEEIERLPLQQALTMLDEDYPKCLLDLKYPPFVLFYKGDLELLKEKKVAVVGSRLFCSYGKQVTERIVFALNSEYTIVSGMAKGIDGIAHSCAKKSIGVLGNGIDIAYPKENGELYKYMMEHQLLISEYPYGVEPKKYHFPFRNRIIAALGDSVIVTQARRKSGTMLTVNEAIILNKDIYVVPYRITDIEGTGCNELIEQGANIILDYKLFDKF